MFNKQKHLVSLFSTAAACLILASSAKAATIVYDFTGGSAAATTNDFLADGVTAGSVSTTGSGSNTAAGTSATFERLQRKLFDQESAIFTIMLTIGSTAIDLASLSFVDGIDSNQGTNNTFSQWDVTISTGSANPSSVTNSLTTGSTGETFKSNVLALSGLTGLSDTTVTFTFTANYGVTSDFSGSGNNNNRFAYIDDLTFTGSVIPEPTTALLGSLGLLFLLRRRR